MVLTSSHGDHQSQFKQGRSQKKARQKVRGAHGWWGECKLLYFTEEGNLAKSMCTSGEPTLFPKRCESQLDTVKILLG